VSTVPVEVKNISPKPTILPDAWRSLRTEMDRLFDRFTSGFGMTPFGKLLETMPAYRLESAFAMPTPAMDITESPEAYTLTAELPGMSEKEIEIAVAGEMLTVKGEKKQEREEKGKNFYLSERAYGAFERSFALPDSVDASKVAAGFAKGVLTVTMPKKPEAKAEPKKIEVKAAA
jgi:HSP20 family protein